MQRFTALDSWRGLSACAIALLHLSLSTNWSFHDARAVENAFVLVDFFFVLSGFIIATTYEDRFANGYSPTTYIILRIGRLYPLHLATLAAVLGLRVVFGVFPLSEFSISNVFDDGPFSLASFIANLFLVQSFIGVDAGSAWNGPSWSISAEFYTYILFAGVWAFFAAAAPSQRMRHLVHASVLALCFVYLLISPLGMYRDYDLGVVRCVYGFSAGVLLRHAYIWVKRQPIARHTGLIGATAIEAVAVALVAGLIAFAHDQTLIMFAPAVFGLTVLVFAFERGALSRLLQLPLFVSLGVLSYSIYMVHFVVLLFEIRLFWIMADKLGWAVTSAPAGAGEEALWGASPLYGNLIVAANMIAFVAIAALTYRFVETPGRDWARRFARRREERRAAAGRGAASQSSRSPTSRSSTSGAKR